MKKRSFSNPGEIKITPVFKSVDKSNKVSGHKWSEPTLKTGFHVMGGKWFTTYHKTIESAEEEVATRKRIDGLLEEMKKEGTI